MGSDHSIDDVSKFHTSTCEFDQATMYCVELMNATPFNGGACMEPVKTRLIWFRTGSQMAMWGPKVTARIDPSLENATPAG
ncbi:hypothetical protein EV182_005184, partial [Spiromyces aspiralis]